MADSPLAALGFDGATQRLYGVVLRNPEASLEELARSSQLDAETLAQALDALREAGLVRQDGGCVVPLAAEVAVGRLISSQASALRAERERLEVARRRLPDFLAEHQSLTSLTTGSVAVEFIRGRDVVALLRRIAATAPGDMLWMRPDQWRYDDGRQADAVVKELMAEGRESRVLYPTRAIEEAPAAVRDRAEAGEQVRFLAVVPTRLAILGASLALIPQRLGTDVQQVAVIRQEGMVDALRLWFESQWERALPMPGLDQATDQDASRRLLLEQLATGAKDEQIARNLGISLRTVRRRVAELMGLLGAESRFQAGTEAVRRGWL